MKNILCLLLIISIFLSLPLVSCSDGSTVPCREVLKDLTEAESGLPAGKIYDMSAETGSNEYLPERLIAALYGDGKSPPVRSGWLDVALFLPVSSHPCEFAVILCDSGDSATDTARLLLRRLDTLRSTKSEAGDANMLDNATVTIIGNYVLLIISSNTENALKAVKRKI